MRPEASSTDHTGARDLPRPALGQHILGLGLGLVLRACAATWRKRIVGRERLEAAAAGGEPVLVAFWHGEYVPLFALLRDWPGCILTNRSSRGQVIASLSTRFGHRALQVPEDRARIATYLHATLAQETWVGIAVDGPAGPYHQVRSGLLRLAAELGFAILPLVADARSQLRLRRWDRMKLPLPFTRLTVFVGEPLRPPRVLEAEDLQAWAGRLRTSLEELGLQAGALPAERCSSTSGPARS